MRISNAAPKDLRDAVACDAEASVDVREERGRSSHKLID
ncbi:hypothetical protein PsAD37_03625 [Pseudovibrio sp. Ad37]|nr:hypothetical protein PsAD37_03625 [Pseudovibrio sp. Ad37]